MVQNIMIEIKCAHCNHSLMDEGKQLDSKHAIRIKVSHGDATGFVYLSSIYGSYTKEFEQVPDEHNGIYEFACPYCNKAMDVVGLCECKAPMISLLLKQGGRIKICTRNGCQHHSMEFEDMNDAFQLLVNNDPTGLG
ncbi:MAG: hypothetical protein Kow00108_08130 [Calditrichia bacterium]